MPPDAEFMSRYKNNFEEAKNYVSRPVGEFSEMISSRDAMFGPSKFVDLIHTIQLDLTDADVSFSAPLSFNAKIDKGTVYVKDMFDLYRYENLTLYNGINRTGNKRLFGIFLWQLV